MPRRAPIPESSLDCMHWSIGVSMILHRRLVYFDVFWTRHIARCCHFNEIDEINESPHSGLSIRSRHLPPLIVRSVALEKHFPLRRSEWRFTAWFGVSSISLSLAFLYSSELVTFSAYFLSHHRLPFLPLWGTASYREVIAGYCWRLVFLGLQFSNPLHIWRPRGRTCKQLTLSLTFYIPLPCLTCLRWTPCFFPSYCEITTKLSKTKSRDLHILSGQVCSLAYCVALHRLFRRIYHPAVPISLNYTPCWSLLLHSISSFSLP